MSAFLAALALLLAPAATIADDDRPEVAGSMPLVYESRFDERGMDGWAPTDPAAWRIASVEGVAILEQFAASAYEPKVRSPFNIALLTGPDLADFVLDLKVRSTTRDYNHRDACLVFGHQDPSHFYYVHLGKEADPHAHSIFLVNDAPRVSIARQRTAGTPWTDGWHHVRVVRTAENGLIAVYFDDMETPIMTTTDTTFTHGRIGVGTFDDTAQFDHIRIWGNPTAPK